MKKKQIITPINELQKLKKNHLFGFLYHHAKQTKMSFLDQKKKMAYFGKPADF